MSRKVTEADTHIPQKRKRSREINEEENRPRKSRMVDTNVKDHKILSTSQENQAQDKDIESTDPTLLKKEKGQARQLKSERRSKKSKSALASKEKNDPANSGKNLKYVAQEVKPQKTDEVKKPPASTPTNTATPIQKSEEVPEKHSEKEPQTKQKSARPPRFIVFVGNLPFDISESDIESHFEKLRPFKVRHRLNKATGRSKGFAFVEFDSYDKMKSCLKLYHHSLIIVKARAEKSAKKIDHQSKEKSESQGRRINIELTVGGGGNKSQGRKDKIKAKNQKLAEEREKTWSKEKAARDEAEPAAGVEVKPSVKTSEDSSENVNIHPSRLARVKY